MAMDDNPRVFKLIVQEIDVRLTRQDTELFEDQVEIEYLGKVMPSTKKRIEHALKIHAIDNVPVIQTDRRLA